MEIIKYTSINIRRFRDILKFKETNTNGFSKIFINVISTSLITLKNNNILVKKNKFLVILYHNLQSLEVDRIEIIANAWQIKKIRKDQEIFFQTLLSTFSNYFFIYIF